MKSFFYAVWEIVEVAAIAIVAVLMIRNFLVQPFLVNGASMEPNFYNSDYLLVDEISYRFREPQRGEVVVFKYPGDERFYYIKRIIGLPGEEIQIKDGKVFVFNNDFPNGFVLKEPYLSVDTFTSGKGERLKIEAGEYFVMGDNRNFSFDSRSWGLLARKEIIGITRLRLWPLNKVMAFKKPAY